MPNHLWTGGFVVDDPTAGALRAARVLDAIGAFAKARDVRIAPDGSYLDGGLIAFEAVPEELRDDILGYLRAEGLGDIALPDGFVDAVRMYPNPPGSWMSRAGVPWQGAGHPAKAERYVATVVLALADGQGPGATAVKGLALRQCMDAGMIKFARGIIEPDLLIRYPYQLSKEEQAEVEGFFRASYGGISGLDDERASARRAWAKSFWTSNWSLFPCRELDSPRAVTSDTESQTGQDAEREQDLTGAPEETGGGAEAGDRLASTWKRFLELAYRTDPDLDDPDRYEVVTGLAAHGLREAIAVAAHPGLWIGEFSAPMLRVVVEILIVLAWLADVEKEDPSIYRKFKEFGRGRAKLMKLHAEDLADSAPAGADLLEGVIGRLSDEVNAEVFEEFQDISLEATFSGLNLRQMALAAGRDDLYKLGLAPMSAVTHSEWPALAKYALQTCANATHKLHHIPRPTLEPALRPVAGETAAHLASQLVEAYEHALEAHDRLTGAG